MKAARRATYLPFHTPSLGPEETREVLDTLISTWITTGPKTRRFESEFAAYLGAPGALALNSCTAGLHLALATHGLGPGDEVVTTPMTFCASVNVIEHVGARPVLVDVEPDTLNLDPRRVEAVLTDRTRAILPVHYAGHPAEMDPLAEIASERELLIVEDAAHALPARYRGVLVGASENPVAFSFYSTKNLTTGEGGMLTGRREMLDRARVLGLHGMSWGAWGRYEKGGSWYYEVEAPGFKYNMTDLQAALGVAQLAKLAGFQARRREIVAAYSSAFGETDAFELPAERPHVEHAWHLYVLRLRTDVLTIGRDRFIEELKERNIGASVHFIPVHVHPYYRDRYGFRPDDFPVAYDSYTRMLSLPLGPALTDEDVADVIAAVLDVARSFTR